jgi:hypothetical protein
VEVTEGSFILFILYPLRPVNNNALHRAGHYLSSARAEKNRVWFKMADHQWAL